MKLSTKKALISVSDKSGLSELAPFLKEQGFELIASGGTMKYLMDLGLPVTSVEKWSHRGEAFKGRMKTLSFEIASSLLFRRHDPEDVATAEELGLEPIDLVVVNLYPFHQALEKKLSFAECIENIDIGGPTLLRAGAKNHESVTVLSSPDQYADFIADFDRSLKQSTSSFREKCAAKVFTMTACYDLAIANYLTQKNESTLRYGENPHQKASLLVNPFCEGLAHHRPLQGKEMSYNNYLDADFAMRALEDLCRWQQDYSHPSVVVVKHNTPCGMAVAETPLRALEMAWKGDEKSSFGGVLAVNFPVTLEIAMFFKEKFIEIILATSFSVEAQAAFKKSCRLVPHHQHTKSSSFEVRSIRGGYLMQTPDQFSVEGFQTMTSRAFPQDKWKLAEFAHVCVKNLKSNAISVCAQRGVEFEMITLGSGQTNRVDCIEKLIASRLMEKEITDVSEYVLASDAFFPFSDSVEAAHKLGIQYVVQPGGSVRDNEVIEKANQLGMAMIFSGERHFLH